MALIWPGGDGDTMRDANVRARFASVDTWVFDLDNTLYPSDSDLWPKIDMRITLFLAELFGLDGMSSRALQKFYYQRYGTTLRGLMMEHAISPEEFLRFVHDIDRTGLAPDKPLAAAIAALPGRKLILTNGASTPCARRKCWGWTKCSRTFSTSSPPISCPSRPRRPT
jgi:putative hydrolase of the HAD superfamily